MTIYRRSRPKTKVSKLKRTPANRINNRMKLQLTRKMS
jgi:hypothetical protein